MFLLAQIVTREQRRSLVLSIASASAPEARSILLDHLPDGVDKVFNVTDLDRFVASVRTMPIVPRRSGRR